MAEQQKQSVYEAGAGEPAPVKRCSMWEFNCAYWKLGWEPFLQKNPHLFLKFYSGFLSVGAPCDPTK